MGVYSTNQFSKIEINGECMDIYPSCSHDCKITFLDGTVRSMLLTNRSIYVLVQNVAREKFNELDRHLLNPPMYQNHQGELLEEPLPALSKVLHTIFTYDDLDYSDMDNFLDELDDTEPSPPHGKFQPRWVDGEYVMDFD